MTNLRVYILAIFTVLFWSCTNTAVETTQHKNTNKEKDSYENQSKTNTNAQIPNYVLEIYDFVIKNNRAPEGYVGGRQFKNRENLLPKKTEMGKQIIYREWDVHKKAQGVNRGAERLVTDNFGNAYYTNNHYRSFIKIE